MRTDASPEATSPRAEKRLTRSFKLGDSFHGLAERMGAAMAGLLPEEVERLRRYGTTFGAGNLYEAWAIIVTELAHRSPDLEAAVIKAAATRDISPVLRALGTGDVVTAEPEPSAPAAPAPRRTPGDPNDVEARALPRLVTTYVATTTLLQAHNELLDAIHADTLPGVAAIEEAASAIQAAAGAGDVDRIAGFAPKLLDEAAAIRTALQAAGEAGDRVVGEVIQLRTRALATVHRRPVEIPE